MTIPRSINISNGQGRPVFGEIQTNMPPRNQDIFRHVNPEKRSVQSWYPPLYRNTTLLSCPSQDIPGCSSYHRTEEHTDNTALLPVDFMPPRYNFSPGGSPTTKPKSSRILGARGGSSSSLGSASSNVVVQLRPQDIVCGRGAPTQLHPGNQDYRELIKEHETAYLCSKRSDKPVIAMNIMQALKARGARFVRRGKKEGRSYWVEIGEHRAYEKVCQSLREGAPELRRQMLASNSQKSVRDKAELREVENYSPLPCFF